MDVILDIDHACRVGHIGYMRKYVEDGGDVNAVDVDGVWLLIQAIRYGQKDAVIFLIDNGADVHMRDSDGYTTLHYACYFGCYDVVTYITSSVNYIVNKLHY